MEQKVAKEAKGFFLIRPFFYLASSFVTFAFLSSNMRRWKLGGGLGL